LAALIHLASCFLLLSQLELWHSVEFVAVIVEGFGEFSHFQRVLLSITVVRSSWLFLFSQAPASQLGLESQLDLVSRHV